MNERDLTCIHHKVCYEKDSHCKICKHQKESAWEMVNRLFTKYDDKFILKLCEKLNMTDKVGGLSTMGSLCDLLIHHTSEEAIEIMQKIKEELKDE